MNKVSTNQRKGKLVLNPIDIIKALGLPPDTIFNNITYDFKKNNVILYVEHRDIPPIEWDSELPTLTPISITTKNIVTRTTNSKWWDWTPK